MGIFVTFPDSGNRQGNWFLVSSRLGLTRGFHFTGAVVLSGFLNAARISSAASGLPLSEHRILFFGAGSSGIGVAKQLVSFFTELGLSVDEAKKQIYVPTFFLWYWLFIDAVCMQTVDSKGLITADREGLQEHKKCILTNSNQTWVLTLHSCSFCSHGLPGPCFEQPG